MVWTADFRKAFILLACASAVMTSLMAMGPMSSMDAGHTISVSSLIIQFHMIGMFTPSLFSGKITGKWGAHRSGLCGAALLAFGTGCGMLGTGAAEMAIALLFVGIGWNFLYVAGSSYVLRCYPRGAGGRVQGAMEGSVGALGALGSFTAAEVLNHIGWSGANLVATAMILCVIGWLLFDGGMTGAVELEGV